jgi:transposase InsO family protein
MIGFFVTVRVDARAKNEAWRRDYNHRPHSALGHLTPSMFVIHRQGTRTVQAGTDP